MPGNRPQTINHSLPAGRTALAPVHPGVHLREDVLPGAGLNSTEAARLLGVSRRALGGVLAGRVRITSRMAARVGVLFSDDPGVWLRLQANYDAGMARAMDVSAVAALKKFVAAGTKRPPA